MMLSYTTKELDLAARLMRAEALGEGDLGMLMVGNVLVNRAISDCLDFKNIRTITQAVYQSPGGFSGASSPLFQTASTTKEKSWLKDFKGRILSSCHQCIMVLQSRYWRSM